MEILMQVAPALVQVQNRIDDQLARGMQGHIAAAVDRFYCNTLSLNVFLRKKNVFQPGQAPAGDHGLVLTEDHEGRVTLLGPQDQLLLPFIGLDIGNEAQIDAFGIHSQKLTPLSQDRERRGSEKLIFTWR